MNILYTYCILYIYLTRIFASKAVTILWYSISSNGKVALQK